MKKPVTTNNKKLIIAASIITVVALVIGGIILAVNLLQNSGPSRSNKASDNKVVSYNAAGQKAIPFDGKGSWQRLSEAYTGKLDIDFNAKVNYKIASDGKDVAVTVVSFSEVPAALKGFDPATGSQKWSVELPKDVRTAAEVSDGVVVQALPNSRVAYDAATGKKLWEKDAQYSSDEKFAAQGVFIDGVYYFVHNPSLGYVTSQNPDFRGDVASTIYGVDVKTGEERYRLDVYSRDDSKGDPINLAGTGETIVTVNTENGDRVAYSKDLKAKWTQQGSEHNSLGSDGFGEIMYSGKIHTFGDYAIFSIDVTGATQYLALDSQNGEKLWSKKIEKIAYNPVVVGDKMIYMHHTGSNGYLISALDINTGEKVWQKTSELELINGITVVDNTLFESGHGLAIRNPNTGEVTSKVTRKYGNQPPVSAAGHLVTVGPDGVFGYK